MASAVAASSLSLRHADVAVLSLRKVSSSSSSLPSTPLLPFSGSILKLSSPSFVPATLRFSPLSVNAFSTNEKTSSSVEAEAPAEDLVADLKEKWDKLENKSTVLTYGGGALLAIWLSTIVVSAINTVPLLPKIMELVGLGYTGWFVYRYLLFKESRKELVLDIEDLKSKITGSREED